MTTAAAPGTFPVVPWARLPSLMQWRQGEHATLVATTGQGKTTLVRKLLPISPAVRRYVMVLATKKRDRVLTAFKDDGYRTMQFPQEWAEHVIVYPPFPRDPDKMLEAHREVFRAALAEAYAAHGWTVYLDEVRYLSNDLGLKPDITRLLLQGRSLGITVIAATQRPRHVPLELYDQPTHLFFWRDNDHGNVQRIGEIGGGVDRGAIMERVPNLPQHQFLYVNTRTGTIVESKVVL